MAVNSFSGLPAIPASYGFTAGKNKIINGDFGIWQRGTSFTPTAGAETYTADRWVAYVDGTVTSTYSRQAFTAGTAPVSGYESQYFARMAVTSQSGGSGCYFYQKIEDVRTFAGQTVTLSVWAKADASRNVSLYATQNFGSGGSSAVNGSPYTMALTTSWQRFTYTVAIPSISGKTIGTGSFLAFYIQGAANTAQTIDVWGAQIEAGSTATAFQTATGTLAGELAACQRYLPCLTVDGSDVVTGQCYSTTQALISYVFPVQPRVKPTGITVSAAGDFSLRNSTAGFATCTAIAFNSGGPIGGAIVATVASGLTAGNATTFFGNSPGRILWTGCEL